MDRMGRRTVLRLKRKRDVPAREALALEIPGTEGDEPSGKRLRELERGGKSAPQVLSFVKIGTVGDEEMKDDDTQRLRYIDVLPVQESSAQEFTCNGVQMERESGSEDVVYDLFVESIDVANAAAERVRLEDPYMSIHLVSESKSESEADQSDSQGTVDYPSTPEYRYDGQDSHESYLDTAYDPQDDLVEELYASRLEDDDD